MWVNVCCKAKKYCKAVKMVHSTQCTGNPTEENIERCCQLVYSKGRQSKSRLFDCVNNKAYFMGKPLNISPCWDVQAAKVIYDILMQVGFTGDDFYLTVTVPIELN